MLPHTFVGLHIPKCAGTSFLHMAMESLPRHQVYQNTSIIMNWKDKQPEFSDIQDYQSLRIIWGHDIHEQMLHYVRNPILFTGMRDPVSRLISEARYQVDLKERQGMQFDVFKWLLKQRNPMTWFIINRFPTLADHNNKSLTPFDKAKKALSSFHHVYFTETFEKSSRAIFRAIGVDVKMKETNKSVKKDLNIEVNKDLLKYDMELYAWARDEFSSKKLNLSTSISPDLEKFLGSQPQSHILESFLLSQQAGEYFSWGALSEVIEDRITRATRLLKEAEYYRKKKDKK